MDSGHADPEVSDETLAKRVGKRDKLAFTLLYDRYARAVYALAATLLGATEADEIAQEVFLQLWRRAHQFDSTRGTFKAWFMTIARNRVMDALHNRSEQERLLVTDAIDDLLVDAIDHTANVEVHVQTNEDGRQVAQALVALPTEQRRALVMAYFGGLSQSSISKQLNVPLGTVKKRIRLGLQKLRTALVQIAPSASAAASHKDSSPAPATEMMAVPGAKRDVP